MIKWLLGLFGFRRKPQRRAHDILATLGLTLLEESIERLELQAAQPHIDHQRHLLAMMTATEVVSKFVDITLDGDGKYEDDDALKLLKHVVVTQAVPGIKSFIETNEDAAPTES